VLNIQSYANIWLKLQVPEVIGRELQQNRFHQKLQRSIHANRFGFAGYYEKHWRFFNFAPQRTS